MTQPLTLSLTDDEAGLLIHMLGCDMVGIMRTDPNDPRVSMLSDLVVRLQLAREIERAATDHPVYDAARRYYPKRGKP